MSEKLEEASKRLMEEELYKVVVDEVKNNNIREGLMAKALVEVSGDKEQARLVYIQLRIQSMIDEAALQEAEEQKAQAEVNRRRVDEKKEQENRDYENWRVQTAIAKQNNPWPIKVTRYLWRLFLTLLPPAEGFWAQVSWFGWFIFVIMVLGALFGNHGF